MTASYSGTPLAKKLSLKDGLSVWFHAMPESVRDEIGEIPSTNGTRPKRDFRPRISLRRSAPNSNAC